MKKKIAILISLAMVLTFALAACGGGGGEDLSDSKYVGSWVAKSLSIGDESGDIGDEGVFTLTLNGDGTAPLYLLKPTELKKYQISHGH